MPAYSTDKGFTGSGAAYSSKTTTTRSSAPNAAAAAASARLNSGNAGNRSVASGVGNQMGGGGIRTDTTNKGTASVSRAGSAGSLAASRMGGNNNPVARALTSSPMGAVLGAFGGGGGIPARVSSPFGFGNAQMMASHLNMPTLNHKPEIAAAMGFVSPFAGNGVAGDPQANRQPVVGQVNRDDIRVPQRALPGFSQSQFGNQRYAPGQMYANPATQGAALRSVVNGIQLQGGTPQQQLGALYSNMGYSNPYGRAGMIGTFDHESDGFAKDVMAGQRGGDQNTAYGLGQWRGDRQTGAQNYVNAMGFPANSLLGQGAFAGTELANKYGDAFNGVQAAGSVQDATASMLGYERPGGYDVYQKTGDPSAVAGWNDRMVRAENAYGSGPVPGPAPTPAPAPAQVASTKDQDRSPLVQSLIAESPMAGQGRPWPNVLGKYTTVSGKKMTGQQYADTIQAAMLDNYNRGRPATSNVVAANDTPAQDAGSGFGATIKGLMPQSVQDKIDAGTAAYTQYADQYAKMPGSDAQKAAAIKGYAQNGILGGAWGYLTGGGVGPMTPANVDDPSKPNYRGGNQGGDNRTKTAQNTVSEQQLSQLSAGQRSEYERLIGAGLSPTEALKAAKAYSAPTTTPTVPGWTQPTFITRPYTRVV